MYAYSSNQVYYPFVDGEGLGTDACTKCLHIFNLCIIVAKTVGMYIHSHHLAANHKEPMSKCQLLMSVDVHTSST